MPDGSGAGGAQPDVDPLGTTVAVTAAACAVAGVRATMPAPTRTVATVEPTSRDLFTNTNLTVNSQGRPPVETLGSRPVNRSDNLCEQFCRPVDAMCSKTHTALLSLPRRLSPLTVNR